MKEEDSPTRAEIEKVLITIPKDNTKNKLKDKKDRNKKRSDLVKEKYSKEIFEKVESDLPSYPQWENEE